MARCGDGPRGDFMPRRPPERLPPAPAGPAHRRAYSPLPLLSLAPRPLARSTTVETALVSKRGSGDHSQYLAEEGRNLAAARAGIRIARSGCPW